MTRPDSDTEDQRSMQSQGHDIELPSAHAESASHIFKKRKVFNDPIHGQIELHPVCVRIVDTPQFQRLRHIKQLDTCYLVYPGASHNRFEHSLGVSYLAGKFLKTIRERQPGENITDRDILCVEIAGLCHDLGQGPFSHVFEKRLMPRFNKRFTHEGTARKMFEYMLDECQLKDDIQEILASCKIPDFREFEAKDFKFMLEMIDDPKDIETGTWPYEGRDESKSYMYEIVANKRNGIDVDKWDYIARDSYMLGMKVNFDYNRCFAGARIIECKGSDGNGNNASEGTQDSTKSSSEIVRVLRKQICYREKEAQDLYDMFYSRLTLHRRAYQHKTHNIIGMMICDALHLANDTFRIAGKKISETVDDMNAFTNLTDDVIPLILHYPTSETQGTQTSETNVNRSGLNGARDILYNIMKRKLYKCVAEIHTKKGISEDQFKEKFNELLTEGGLSLEENFIDFDIVKFDYGMGDRDPLEKVRFYKKEDMKNPIKLEKNQVSYVLPDTFAEHVIRIYCKVKASEDDKQRIARVSNAFAEWCNKKGLPPPKGKEDPQRACEPNQQSNASTQTDANESIEDSFEHKAIPEPEFRETTDEQPGSYHAGGVERRPEQDSPSAAEY